MNARTGAGHWALLLLLLVISSAGGHADSPSFSPGILYRYLYMLDVQAKHLSQPSMPESRLRADATVQTHLLWRDGSRPGEQLVHVQMLDLKIHQAPDGKNETSSSHLSTEDLVGKETTANLTLPVLFHWNSGKIEGLYGTVEGSRGALDLKRGLVSLFQLQLFAGTLNEDDVSGKCQVSYNVSKDSIIKTKDLHSCTSSSLGFTSANKVFGVQWQPSSISHYYLKNNLIQSVVSEESHVVSLNLKSTLGTRITSRQQIELVSSTAGPSEIPGQSLQDVLAQLPGKYRVMDFTSQPLKRTCENCPSLETLTAGGQPVGKDIAKASSTRRFHVFVQALRHAKKRDVLQLLKKASEKSLPFVIDAAVAAQSAASLAALSEFLDFKEKKQAQFLEKFLYAAAFVPRPSKDLLRIILDKLTGQVTDPAIMESGIIVIGALVRRMCQMKLCSLKEVEYAKATVVEGLKQTVDASEKKIYLLSLKNARLPETIPLLLEHAEKGSGVVSGTALSVLQSFPAKHITSKVKKALRRIFHQTQRKYENTSRLSAAEILLVKDPLPMDVINILLALDEMNAEIAKLLLSKIQIIQRSQHPARKVIQEVLKDPWINNYSLFSRTGSSSAFSGLLAAAEDMQSTYSLELLFTKAGLLRQSVSDFALLSHGHRLQASQVSVEAQGLESLMEGTDEGDENQEAMAGMSAILFDVQLRPVVFFQGYTDLLTKLFASSGEPTSVVKGNILLIDHLQEIPLQSGLQVAVEFQGGLGLDISADIDISLWDQESKTRIKTRAGLAIDLKAKVGTDFFQADVKAQVDAELTFSFDTMVKFFETPVRICLQLKQDQLPYREMFSLSESFLQQNVTRMVRKGKRTTVPGREFPLHWTNSEMCKALLMEQQWLEPEPEQMLEQ